MERRNFENMRLRVEGPSGTREYAFEQGESVLYILRKNGEMIEAPCGGNGTCGKCRIRVQGEADLRMACCLRPQTDMTVWLPYPEQEFSAVTEYVDVTGHTGMEEAAGVQKIESIADGYGIAVDLGTTTLAFSLYRLSDGTLCGTHSALNRQRIFGADVISRIRAANDGHDWELCSLIRSDLSQGMQRLMETGGVGAEQIRKIALAGNTTMTHLLLHYSCAGMGEYPFLPFSLEQEARTSTELFDVEGLDCDVMIFPGISAFVGGDITAGLFAEHFAERKKCTLFLDLGTNGEMALGNGQLLLTASAAAGPAFEGGGITWGTGSIEGAVSGFRLSADGAKEVITIGGKTPCGICGSGAVEIIAGLLEQGLIDETGLLAEPYFAQGYPVSVTETGETIFFTQKDIREIQMAKAAIRAGIELLIEKAGITCDEVDAFVIAGGFGFHLNPDSACRIGLLPKACRGRMYAAGNTSLLGAGMSLFSDCLNRELQRLSGCAREVSLANEKGFQEVYMAQMYFPDKED